NSMLSAIGLEGKDYFYTNPLRRGFTDVPLWSQDSAERWPNTTPASPVHCFCCPPSLARTIAQLHTYAYGMGGDTVWIHLYGASRLDTQLPGGDAIQLTQTTDYPWDGKISIRIEKAQAKEMALRLRIPGWVEQPVLKINGQVSSDELKPGSYSEIRRNWKAGDVVELQLPMPAVLMESNPLVEETRNQVAVMRGPLVYCLEDKDLPPGTAIQSVRIQRDAKWTARHESNLLHGVTVLETQARVVSQTKASTALYRRVPTVKADAILLRLIPYYAWCNRGASEMTVWLPAL
ncbi:MAG: glycoside hydrolase family 127 protein, partial [Verrucomicrobia bacterium]|nr:glycoside hydrolase family 127 protein [Verrucomicrobiota bacterium]